MEKLRDPGFRPNYMWIRQRINRTWPMWLHSAQNLASSPRLSNDTLSARHRKQVLEIWAHAVCVSLWTVCLAMTSSLLQVLLLKFRESPSLQEASTLWNSELAWSLVMETKKCIFTQKRKPTLIDLLHWHFWLSSQKGTGLCKKTLQRIQQCTFCGSINTKAVLMLYQVPCQRLFSLNRSSRFSLGLLTCSRRESLGMSDAGFFTGQIFFLPSICCAKELKELYAVAPVKGMALYFSLLREPLCLMLYKLKPKVWM